MKDVLELEKIGCGGVIIGKAIYEGRITMNELKNYSFGRRIGKKNRSSFLKDWNGILFKK